jgi:choline dehydrogenase-like flavoprotein
LTAENLETAFYQQGFAKFQDSDFAALGLSEADITNLKSIGGAGTQPVQPCTYNFGFTTAAAMVATAAVLENIGVSAYVLFYIRG